MRFYPNPILILAVGGSFPFRPYGVDDLGNVRNDVDSFLAFDAYGILGVIRIFLAKIWMATTKAKRLYTDVSFSEDDYIMFGKESAGIPEEILVEYEEAAVNKRAKNIFFDIKIPPSCSFI